MKIALVSPLYESVPPQLYGGTERVVSYLCEELVTRGHEVTLFASGDSCTKATLVPICKRALRISQLGGDHLAWHLLQCELVAQAAKRFDLIHFHNDYLHFSLSRRMPTAHLTTLHGRLDSSDLQALYAEFSDMPLVSISDVQRAPLPEARWIGTVYHGLPPALYSDRYSMEDGPQGGGKGGYLAFLGRISPEKGLERAITIAAACGMRLLIAAKVDDNHFPYFEHAIKPLLRLPHVEYVGEIGERDKAAFLGEAKALLFPIDWPEPFGLVMIEALACGTPVIAFRCGSVPEVLEHGKNGFIVRNVEEAIAAVGRLGELRRADCRASFLRRFSVSAMTDAYLALYRSLLCRPAQELAG